MAISPVHSGSPVAESQASQTAPPKSAAKESTPLPQDTVTLSAAAKSQQQLVAKDPPPKAASSGGDQDGQ